MYVKPLVSLGFDPSDGTTKHTEGVRTRITDWLNRVRRGNTPDGIVFPNMSAGDVLIHNFTVWHAVAPIESGSRYSFVLFYDMDNPAIQRTDFDEDAIGDDNAGGGGGREERGWRRNAGLVLPRDIGRRNRPRVCWEGGEYDDADGGNEAEAIVVSRGGAPPSRNCG